MQEQSLMLTGKKRKMASFSQSPVYVVVMAFRIFQLIPNDAQALHYLDL
jgi:hypothetical protein